MKKLFVLMISLALGSLLITGCKKDDDDEEQVKTVTLGAQNNTAIPGFYSVANHLTYTMEQAYQYQDAIDIFCFYEAAGGNNIALASPGSNITGIFTGTYSVENWTTKRTTRFFKTALTAAQFDALLETDSLIVTSYDSTSAYKKAKNVQLDEVWAFKTTTAQNGLLKVTSVVQGDTGKVAFDIKIKK